MNAILEPGLWGIFFASFALAFIDMKVGPPNAPSTFALWWLGIAILARLSLVSMAVDRNK